MATREELKGRIRTLIGHVQNHTTGEGEVVYKIPTSMYRDENRWKREVDEIFRRRPLVLALSGELRNPNDYKAIDIAGVPVIVHRGSDGVVHAFYNACRHRAAQVTQTGTGNSPRHVCPYHGWSYDQRGCLRGIPAQSTFGEVDKSQLGLTQLPVEERHGLIWGVLTPGIELDLDDWLGDAGPALEELRLDELHHFSTRVIKGPNWKVAMDGYLEVYHFAVLHPNTFNKTLHSNVAEVQRLGRHQRIYLARRGITELDNVPEEDWEVDAWLSQATLLFPNVDFAFSFLPGRKDDVPEYGRHCLMHMIFPGASVDESITYQINLTSKPVTNERDAEALREIADGSYAAVSNEDYWVGSTIQKTLPFAASEFLMFGRNEEALTHFHRHLDELLKES